MKVIVTGSTGLVGEAVVGSLLSDGHEVTRMVRGEPGGRRDDGTSAAPWDPSGRTIDAAALEGHDAVVHLAGEPIADGRWDEKKKRRIRDSRVLGTSLISEAVARLKDGPRALLSASATGYYGDRGDELLTEESAPGDDFLSEVCREWEAATRGAAEAGLRVVNLRMGIVLSSDGGALAKMLTPFKLGVGGRIGSGRQYLSWITLEDLVHVIRFALEEDRLRGPVNAVAPNPVTNEEFTKTLGRVLGRPTVFPLPSFAARLAFGEMADALLLSGSRVAPARLEEAGFRFTQPELEGALRSVLNK